MDKTTHTVNTGGPAFPHNEKNDDGSHHWTCPGMTLRDWFAGQAIGAALLRSNNPVHMDASDAYIVADAMLKARIKPQE